MTSSLLYAIIGGAWGPVLGVVAGLAVTVFAAGVAWLWLFGDDPWPQAVSWVVPLIGADAGLVVFVACLVIGIRHGRNLERAPAIAMPARSISRSDSNSGRAAMCPDRRTNIV